MTIQQELNNIIDLYYFNCSYLNNIISKSNELISIFKKSTFKKLTQKDIEKYFKYLKRKNNSNATINSKLSFLNQVLKYYNNNLILPYQTVKTTDKNIITEYQFYNLLNIFQNNKDMYTFIMLAYYTGMRANEILNIKSNHIIKDNDNYFINLYNTKNHKDNLIPCTNKLNSILKDFTEFNINYKRVYYLLSKYNINPHIFRHSFISRCYEQGLDSFTIMRLTNQSSLSVHKRYVHLSNKSLIDTVNKLL